MDDLSAIARGLGQFGAEPDFARMLASLVGASHEFIGIADLEGKGLFVNDAGRKLVALPDDVDVQSTRLIDYFAEEDRDQGFARGVAGRARQRLLGGRTKISQFRDRRRSYRCSTTSFRCADLSGEIAAYGTVTRDLTRK